MWPDIFYFFLMAMLLLAAELIYFRIAIRFGIVDRPNDRSSHVSPAIRGGGIIFMVAVLLWYLESNFSMYWLIGGTLAIAIISFLDDVISLNPLIRFLVQLIAVLMMFHQLGLATWPAYLVVAAVIVCIGALNAFNFMDGINGITGVYALVSLVSFGYVHYFLVPFTDFPLLGVTLISVLIFLFFNFRNRARCFAGDVGSVTIAYVLIFFLLQLIWATQNFLWPLFFLVYGTDSIVTIIYRIKRKENIFKAHRTHLFQYLSNELKWPHLTVSLLYGAVQALLNIILILSLKEQLITLPIAVALIFVIFYLLTRWIVIRRISNKQ
jgi:UDP-GlcNAc:undecaprenyl-phosphate/decaprenyl-phosphate GlcNAc-1-phosphate transferase